MTTGAPGFLPAARAGRGDASSAEAAAPAAQPASALPASAWGRRMAAWEPAHTLLVLDLDGTMHRGRFGWARGLSNVDLAFELGWNRRIGGWPIPPLRFSGRVARFWWRERRARAREGGGRAYHEEAIEGFRARVLEGVEAAELREVARRVTRLAHADLSASLRRVASLAGRVLILSKAFEPVVDAYVALVCEATGLPTSGEGNPTDSGRPLRFLSGEEKGAGLASWLGRRPEVRSALVVGDTADDLAVRDAAMARLGLQNVVCAALAPKDEAIRRGADLVAWGWRELADHLEQVGGSARP